MSKENFEAKAAEIELITNFGAPAIPVDTMLQEAENLFIWCQADKSVLVAAGLDWNLVTDLPLRTGALRYTQSIWQQQFLSMEEKQRQWKNQAPVAYGLRNELVHHFLHAYRNRPDLLAHTQRIAHGVGHADMIQDLLDLALLGKANPNPLMAISLDLSLLDRAETESSRMATLLAQTNEERIRNSKIKVSRDKAYTFLKQAIDEIRHHGKYVFWHNNERIKGYVSKYHQLRNRRSKSKDDQE